MKNVNGCQTLNDGDISGVMGDFQLRKFTLHLKNITLISDSGIFYLQE